MVENEPSGESEMCAPREMSHAPEAENRGARESRENELAKKREYIVYTVFTLRKEFW